MTEQVERPQAIGIDHIGLSVTNLETTLEYYCDLLGAQVLFAAHDGGTFRRAVITLGTWMIDLNEFKANDGGRFDVTRTGLDHVALIASSREALEDWANWLDSNNVERSPVREMPAPVVGAMFDFVDPDGIQLEFSYFKREGKT